VKKYSSCVVVDNSGILLNRNYGSLINAREFVIRLNNDRVDNYESKEKRKKKRSEREKKE